MKKKEITLLGVGDVLIDREQPETMFRYVAEVLRSADITYVNCEQALSDKGHPDPRHAAYSSPKSISALLYAGTDVISLANNHIGDWGVEAVLDTMSRLKKAGLPFVGLGNNLVEARQPVILEKKGNKIGFLAYCCVGPDDYMAGDNKPGFAPMRPITYERDPEPGTPLKIVPPREDDLAAMMEDIQKLKSQVDVVVICFHWGLYVVPRIIPKFCYDVGRAAVDAGADLVLGTHTHILKGIEMYKGKAIFYCTGNFAMEFGPHMRDLAMITQLEKHYGIVDYTNHKYTLIAKATIENGTIKRMSYIPCYVNEPYKTEPVIVTRSDLKGQEVFKYVEDVSRSERLSVNFSWDNDEVLIMP